MQQNGHNSRIHGSSRRRFVRIGMLVLVLASAAVGWNYWRQRQDRPRRIFADAMESVHRGELRGVDEAIEFLEDEPGYATQTRVLRGAALTQRGQYTEALLELRYVPINGEFRHPALFWVGRCLHKQGKLAEALDAFHLLTRENPDHVESHRHLAEIYHSLGAMPAALAELKHVERLNPDDYTALYQIGTIYHRDMQRDKEAAAYYRKALDGDPPELARVEIAFQYAESLMTLRKYDEALRAVPARNDARILALKAECQWNLKQRESARQLLIEALRIDPNLRSALMFQAKLHLDDRRPKAAIPPLKRILKDDPHDYPARYLLAQALRKLGDSIAADRELAKMKESERLRTRLRDLYRQAMKDLRDAGIREQIAELCEKLDQHRLAAIWKRAARIARQRAD